MAVIENLTTLTSSVNTVIAAGGSTTSEFERILNRWSEYTESDYSAQAQLAKALLGDTPLERVAELRGLALAENASNQERAVVHNGLAAALYPVLIAEYAKTAQANYATLAAKFNSTAATFTKAATVIDPETPAEQLVHATEAKRRAWTDAGVASLELSAQIPALIEAARLAGTVMRTIDDALSLTTKPGTLHRRRVWEAWNTTTGRTGRWGAMLTLGATIEATPLDEYTRYREPAPMATKYEYNGFGHRPISVDPEDNEHTTGANAEDLARKLNNNPGVRIFR
jgi:hypothetical protein